MKDAAIYFLMACGVAGIADVLWFEGKIGVWLARYISLRTLFKKKRRK